MNKIKYLIITLFLFIPFIVKAESCDISKISIESININNTNGNAVEKENASIQDKIINLDLSMSDVGDSISYQIVVKNDSDDDFILDSTDLNKKSEYMEYTFDNEKSVTVGAKSTKTINLMIEYKNAVPAALLVNDSYTEQEDFTLSLSTLENPKTGNTVASILSILIIVSSILAIYLNNKKSFSMLSIILGLIILLPTSVYAVCKCDITIKSNIEVKKIAEFDTGWTINQKMNALAGNTAQIKTFKRVDTLPNDIKTLVENQLAINDVVVTDEEFNARLEEVANGGYREGFATETKYGLNYYAFGLNDYKNYVAERNIIDELHYDYALNVSLGNPNDPRYLIYNFKDEKVEFLTEEELKPVLRSNLLIEKKNKLTKNIFSSDSSDYLIYGWYDEDTKSINYYCEKEQVNLNRDASYMFSNLNYLESAKGIENLNTVNTSSVVSMFSNGYHFSNKFDLDLSNWNTSNIKDATNMFSLMIIEGIYPSITSFKVNLSNWNTSKLESTQCMFCQAGANATEWIVKGLENWNVSNLKNMNNMFSEAAVKASKIELNLSKWKTSNVRNMSYVFYLFGQNTEDWTIGNISNWDVSKVIDMSGLFSDFGGDNSEYLLDLSRWNPASAIDMSHLFDRNRYLIRGLANWNTSSVKIMDYMFIGNYIDNIGDISNWDVSNVESMEGMFQELGSYQDTLELDLKKWDVSNLKNMSMMFQYVGRNKSHVSINISNWNTKNVESMSNLFYYVGSNASSVDLIINGIKTSSVKDMSYMFLSVGENATSVNIGDISNWDVSNVENMSGMFSNFGYKLQSFNLNLTNWDVSKVKKMSGMFQNAGYTATSWTVGDLSNWDVSNVENMSYMFLSAGYNDTNWTIGDLSNWNTSNVTDMYSMFYKSGYNATNWSIGNLSNWDTSKVTKMNYMFGYAGYNAGNWTSIGTLKVYANDIEGIFYNCVKAKATVNIFTKPNRYSSALRYAATTGEASILVNYTNDVTNIDQIIATKSNTSHITKGEVIQ